MKEVKVYESKPLLKSIFVFVYVNKCAGSGRQVNSADGPGATRTGLGPVLPQAPYTTLPLSLVSCTVLSQIKFNQIYPIDC